MMTVSVDRGKWLVLAGIAVFPLLDVTLFVLMWTLLGRTQPLDHAIRIASVAIVGQFLYRGHRWCSVGFHHLLRREPGIGTDVQQHVRYDPQPIRGRGKSGGPGRRIGSGSSDGVPGRESVSGVPATPALPSCVTALALGPSIACREKSAKR